MSNNFPILIETEEEAVGSVLRLLNKTPGIVGIHLQLEQLSQTSAAGVKQLTQGKPQHRSNPTAPKKVNAYNQGKTRGMVGGVAKVIAAGLMKAPLHKSIIANLLERSGYAAASATSALAKMYADKEIVRTAPGTYRLTPKGEKNYSEPFMVAGSVAGTYRNMSSRKGLRPLVLRLIEANGNAGIEHEKLKQGLTQNNYSDSNMYNMVPRMSEEGLIVRKEDFYFLTDRGRQFLAEVSSPDMAENPTPAIEDKTGELA